MSAPETESTIPAAPAPSAPIAIPAPESPAPALESADCGPAPETDRYIIDMLYSQSKFLDKNRELIKNDNSLFLYRLPLTLPQIARIHANLTGVAESAS